MATRLIQKNAAKKNGIPRIEIRRSSSLQFPLEGETLPNMTKLETNRLASWASSLHTLTHLSQSSSAVNLYVVMARYRCCMGLCRLRVGACTAGCICLVLSVVVLCGVLITASSVSKEIQDMLILPLITSALYQIAASITLLAGIMIEHHLMLLPFVLNCILQIVLNMGLCLVFLITANQVPGTVYPLLAVITISLIILYLWFLVISSMTFVLIRDKKQYSWELDDEMPHSEVHGMERVTSSYF